MYGLPSDFDPDVFVGRELENVTFAQNLIVLRFTGISVNLEGTVPYKVSPSSDEQYESPPVVQSSLVGAVGRTVEATELKSPKELVLRLSNGFEVVLLDDSDQYESYLISFGEREIVV
jgi:hypothetical protein